MVRTRVFAVGRRSLVMYVAVRDVLCAIEKPPHNLPLAATLGLNALVNERPIPGRNAREFNRWHTHPETLPSPFTLP